MKKILISLIIMLIVFLANLVFAQELPPIELNVEINQDNLRPDLAEEQRKLWLSYGIDAARLGNVWVIKVDSSIDRVAEELDLSENELFKGTIGGTINNTISILGEEVEGELGEDWIINARKKAEEYEGITHDSYITNYEYSDEYQYQVNVDAPYISPLSLNLYEGTYITVTEYLLSDQVREEKAELSDESGEGIVLSNELPIKYLQGNWTIRERELESDYETQIPDVIVRIENYIGSIEEEEIDAERHLFSGEIELADRVYKAYTELDPVNIYSDPVCYISILNEEGEEPILDIMLSDMDTDYELYIESDLNTTSENSFAIEIYSSINGEYYETDEDEEDYLVRE